MAQTPISRRDFIKSILALAFGFLLYPLKSFFEKPQQPDNKNHKIAKYWKRRYLAG